MGQLAGGHAAQLTASTTRAYAVPDSDAGLGPITTAPNGDMWFIEINARSVPASSTGYGNILGRIKPTGEIDRWWFTATTQYSQMKDLDVDATGNIWFVYDQGRKVERFDPVTGNGTYWDIDPSGADPWGNGVRIGPDGVSAWVTVGYGNHGLAVVKGDGLIYNYSNPACTSAISRGTSGTMWCTDGTTKIFRIAADASGTQTYPLRADATYPYSLAPGNKGAVWFGRDTGGSMFLSPARGSVGWLDLGSSDAHYIRVGDRVAPRSLKLGPDGNMWFTSVGAAKGIGHVNAAGIGAVTQVGDWHPEGLTFSKDGALWFTDDDNNSIVRVGRDRLQTTNVNVGSNFQIKPVSASRKLALKVQAKGNKRVFTGKATSPWPGCRAGTVQVRRVKGHSSVVVAKGKAKADGSYTVKVKKSKARKGKYFTRILQTKPGGTICSVANSPKRKVH